MNSATKYEPPVQSTSTLDGVKDTSTGTGVGLPTEAEVGMLRNMLVQRGVGLGEIAVNESAAPGGFDYNDILSQYKGNLDQQKMINEANLQEARARLKNTQDSYAADAADRTKAFELSQESLAGRAALEKQLMVDSWNKQKQRNRFNSALAESEADVAQMLKPKQVQLLGVKAGKLV